MTFLGHGPNAINVLWARFTFGLIPKANAKSEVLLLGEIVELKKMNG